MPKAARKARAQHDDMLLEGVERTVQCLRSHTQCLSLGGYSAVTTCFTGVVQLTRFCA